MRQVTSGLETELRVTKIPRKSRRTSTMALTDLVFADGICRLCNEIDQTQELLLRVPKRPRE